MQTILRTSYVFGPVRSRRLGASLGINVLPIKKKICSLNCIYCECGWNTDEINENVPQDLLSFPVSKIIKTELESVFVKIKNSSDVIDVITFSGNGEPTLHPQFAEIIDDTIELRNKYVPSVKIAVLSNSTNLGKEKIINALKKIDKPILKLDSANIDTFEKINLFGINNKKNDGKNKITIEKIIEGMRKFEGNFIFQTMFLKGILNNEIIDNTTDIEINGLIEAMKTTNPKQIMIYSLDRTPPANNLIKLNSNEMKRIANIIENAGFNVMYV